MSLELKALYLFPTMKASRRLFKIDILEFVGLGVALHDHRMLDGHHLDLKPLLEAFEAKK